MLHIYDLGIGGDVRYFNQFMRPLQVGVFHCGIEVYEEEWSFSNILGDLPKGPEHTTGVFSCDPTGCEDHQHAESIVLGTTSLTRVQVARLLEVLQEKWTVATYHILHKNCCHFCQEFANCLGVGKLPDRITRLASVGASVVSGCSTMRSASFLEMFCCSEEVPQRSEGVEYVASTDRIQVVTSMQALQDSDKMAEDEEPERAASPRPVPSRRLPRDCTYRL